MKHRTAIIFDLDGTLTKANLDFDQIRQEIGVSGPILEALPSLSPQEQHRAHEILGRYEAIAAETATLQNGAKETVQACADRGHPVAILTRNSRESADRVLQRFDIHVDMVRSREDGEIKPSPEPVLAICSELGADPGHSWMIGDYLFDIQAGLAAGSTTVLFLDDREEPDYAQQAHHVIRELNELTGLIERQDAS